MQTQAAEAVQNKWKMRDFITLAIFNVVMLIIMTICPIFTVISYLVVGGAAALFSGPIYVVMSSKIAKRGVLFFTCIITGLYFVAFGYAYYLLVLAVIGIICELVLWGGDAYRSTVRNAIGYAIVYVGWSLCGVVPLIFFREQYLATLKQGYSPEQLETMLYYFETPSMVLIMCAISAIGGLLGCWIGNLLMKKHVKKAKLV